MARRVAYRKRRQNKFGMFLVFLVVIMIGVVVAVRSVDMKATLAENRQREAELQDQIAAAFGGLNRIDMSKDGYKVTPVIISNQRKREFNDNLMLFFTGFSRFSSDIQKGTKKSMADKTKQLLEMKALVDQAEDILTDAHSDLNEFGRLLDYTWKLKRGISAGISTDSIDAIYQKAIAAGATGGKLLGAGGGGFLLFYVEQDKQPQVMNALQDLLYVPFEFENDGTQVVYFKAEDYEIPERFQTEGDSTK